jgi:hypothetical protein
MPPKTQQSPSAAEFRPSSLAEWKRHSTMDVILSSGTGVTIRALTIDELAAQGGIPDELLHVALLEQVPGGVVAEIHRRLQEGDADSLQAANKLSQDNLKLRDRLVLAAIVSPRLKAADLKGIDPFDRAMIAEFAQRKRTLDAAGRRVGAQALDTFRIVAEEHGCAPDCPACQTTARRVFGLQ